MEHTSVICLLGQYSIADDVCLISRSCFGLQKKLHICFTCRYGITWDILCNPAKSHTVTFGGNNPEADVQQNKRLLTRV